MTNFTTVASRICSRLKLYKKYTNRLRLPKVLLKKCHIFLVHCVYRTYIYDHIGLPLSVHCDHNARYLFPDNNLATLKCINMPVVYYIFQCAVEMKLIALFETMAATLKYYFRYFASWLYLHTYFL